MAILRNLAVWIIGIASLMMVPLSIGQNNLDGSNTIPGKAGVDYPTYTTAPESDFSCYDYEYAGYFADVESGCQAYHICFPDQRQATFLCGNGTIFNQRYFVCDWWFHFNCSHAPSLYDINLFKRPPLPAVSSVHLLPQPVAIRYRNQSDKNARRLSNPNRSARLTNDGVRPVTNENLDSKFASKAQRNTPDKETKITVRDINKSEVSKNTKPAGGTTNPTGGTTKPASGTTRSAGGITNPTGGPTNPAGGFTKSTGDTRNPGSETRKRTGGTTKPTGFISTFQQNTRYTGGITRPTVGITRPTGGNARATDGITRPTVGITDGITRPTDGITRPTDRNTRPTGGNTRLTGGITNPTDGTTNPYKEEQARNKPNSAGGWTSASRTTRPPAQNERPPPSDYLIIEPEYVQPMDKEWNRVVKEVTRPFSVYDNVALTKPTKFPKIDYINKNEFTPKPNCRCICPDEISELY